MLSQENNRQFILPLVGAMGCGKIKHGILPMTSSRYFSECRTPENPMIDALKRWLRAGIASILLLLTIITLNFVLEIRSAIALPMATRATTTSLLLSRLPAGNPITDGKALLRYA